MTDPTTVVQKSLELSTFTEKEAPAISWTDAAGSHTEPIVGRVLIGSSPNVRLRVQDPAVSRLHAEIELRSDGTVWVRDLGSTNGLWIDGVFVQYARMSAKSQLRVGSTTLKLAFGSRTRAPLWPHDRLGPLIARSEPMRELFFTLSEYARTDSPVLVQGETGTGKELVAQAIHETSSRANKPLVVVDCGALPEAILESELFGHAKGAFTGAVNSRAGAFESADGGTVFIDEIGELPLSMQPKLLRVLESQTVRRLGETSYRKVDIRIIAATHRDLRAMVAKGSFREDLYFRLAVLPAFIPPLRDRPSDVGLLLDHFFAPKNAAVSIDAQLMNELERCPWNGNVRELRSFADRAMAVGPERAWSMTRGLARGASASETDREMPSSERSPLSLESSGMPAVSIDVPFKELREAIGDHVERKYLEALIARFGRQDVGKLASHAGLDRSYVHRLLRKHDL